eukprot:3763852-Rhodomonas_salina.2
MASNPSCALPCRPPSQQHPARHASWRALGLCAREPQLWPVRTTFSNPPSFFFLSLSARHCSVSACHFAQPRHPQPHSRPPRAQRCSAPGACPGGTSHGASRGEAWARARHCPSHGGAACRRSAKPLDEQREL